ncbi:MAG: class E sortase [Acidimicrobiia bacterium]
MPEGMGLAESLGVLRRRMIGGLFVALALVSAALIGSVAVAGSDGSEPHSTLVATRVRSAVPEMLPAATVPSTDAALAAATWSAEHPPPPPPLPVPAELPDASAHRDLVDIGRIQIPKTGVDQTVHEGVEQMVIDAGPAHWPGTADFGGWGNVVLAGHRTSHTEPFLRNAELVPGDEIILSDTTGTYRYAVTGIEVVPNTAMWIKDQHPGRTLTIFTCHPIGSSAERLIVHAELSSGSRPGG